jgi:4-amino-4-deoxy-L-arabinose transferase-like glycosyltransferase
MANNLLVGKGFVFQNTDEIKEEIFYPSIRRAPLYPLIIAFFQKISNGNIDLLRWFQILLDVMTIFLIFIVGKKHFSERVGYIASWIYTFYLPFISLPTVVLPETLLAFFSVLIVFLLLKTFDQNFKIINAILLGITIGITMLIKPTVQLLLPFFIIVTLFCKRKSLNHRIRPIIFSLIISTIVISPWLLRNYNTFGTPLLIAFGGGQALYTGNHIENDGHWVSWDQNDINEIKEEASNINPDPKMKLIIMDKIFMKKAIKSIIAQPLATAKLFIKKFIRFIDRPPSAGYRFGAKELNAWYFPIGAIAHFFHILILGGFLLSFYYSKKQYIFWVPLIFVIYFVVLHTVTFSIARYSVPILPILCIYASYGYSKALRINY